MRAAALAAVASLVVACGSSGDDAAGDAPPAEPPAQGPTGIVQQALTIRGTVFLGDSSTPAAGYELWVLDQTDGGMGRFPLGVSGDISVPLSIFRVGHRYTFHLVLGDRLIGDLDFGASTDGAQSTLIYDGGYAFDLGEVIANVTSRGDVDPDAPGLLAEVGGGFTLDVDSTASFATLPAPEGIEQFQLRSQLIVLDPVTLLYAFYNRDTYPERHAEALLDQSRIVVSVEARSKDTVSHLYVYEGGEWLGASRLASEDPDTSRGSAPLWSSTAFTVPTSDGKTSFASVYTGALLSAETFALFKVEPESGATLTVPRLLDRVYAVPPRPTSIALDGGAPELIDYTPKSASDTETATSTETETETETSTSQAVSLGLLQDDPAADEPSVDETEATTATPQGLLTPFCYGDAGVTLTYDPPLDETGAVIVGERYGVVAVILDYYGVGEDGRTTLLAATAADFPGEFAAAYADAAAANPTRTWDPDTRTATFTWDDQEAATLSSATLTLWPDVFVATAAGSDVTKIRLRVYFRSKDDPGESASALWLRRGC